MSLSQTQVETFEISAVKLIPQVSDANFELRTRTKVDSISSSSTTECCAATTSPFPLQNLPSEIRHEIYAHYFASLPPHNISCSVISKFRQQVKDKQKEKDLGIKASNTTNSSLPPYHTLNPLQVSSPFFVTDIPTFIYYQQTTFSFSCPSALKSFSSPSPSPSSLSTFSSPLLSFSSSTFDDEKMDEIPRKHVRKLRINYGGISDQGPDWVYLMLKAFERLEEVVFVVDEGCRCCGLGSERLEHWWGCVRDAFREGYDGGVDEVRMGEGVRLRLETRRGEECSVVKEA
ncbi:hypothetical protein BDZ45DRAFT_676926 [Acephala macrosclerotiorum]|nr:hypothetical protein BDZ45DRAFT_676926 [Acephala macrosclerotiorum]